MDQCKSAVDAAIELWKKFEGLAPPAVGAIEKSVEAMINFFNSAVGNSPLHIGKRPLPFGALQTGTIESIGDRTFVAPVPTTAPSKIVLTKKAGKGHVLIYVCAVDASGGHTELATLEVSASTPDGHSFEVQVPAGKIPTVLLDGKTLVAAMSYNVLLTA